MPTPIPTWRLPGSSTTPSAVLSGGTGGSFTSESGFAVGDGPWSVAVGEFNADSDPDLAVANLLSDNVSVLLGGPGASAGTFGDDDQLRRRHRPGLGRGGDFNADSKPDLAVANSGPSNDVSVLLGDAGGGFGAATNFPAADFSGFATSLAVGDFNADSDPDLAVANSSLDDVSVLLNTTSASGQPPSAVDDAYSHYGSDTPLATTTATGVLANDTDPDGDPLTAALVSGPGSGSLTLSADGSFSYQPNEDFVGQDSFTYTANDGTADSTAATVTITVGAGCNGRQATITGTAGANNLRGTAGDDVIAGLGRGDMIRSAGGNDTVCGGAGNDELFGGAGNDSLRGGSGSDSLLGGAGTDALRGDAGRDLLSGGAGSPDTCEGDAGTDALAPRHGCEQIGGVP